MTSPAQLEAEWLAAAQSGDAHAFSALVRAHTERLWRTALTLCRDAHLAEDLVQETFAEAWRSLSRFDGRCRFTTWLHSILVHRSHKAARRAASRLRLHEPGDLLATEPALLTSPADDALRAEAGRALHSAVADLPDEHRAVIELRFFADLSLDEIAAALDVPLGTVKSRLHHALAKLRAMNLFPAARES